MVLDNRAKDDLQSNVGAGGSRSKIYDNIKKICLNIGRSCKIKIGESTRSDLFELLAQVVRHQLKNLDNILCGYPLTTPSLGSATLDEDDLLLAKSQLMHRANWFSSDIATEYNSAFAKWNGSKYAFSFMGGRVALSACIYALGLKPGDEVILPGYTCVVVPNAFHFAGIKTVYCDIELDTYGLDASLIENKITEKTKAILLHHLYGLVCRDYEKIIEIANRHKLYLIEDCAQSTGASFKGKKVGNRGDVAIYSSEQSKVFNTIQGGLATTNDDVLAKGLKDFYNQAAYPEPEFIDKLLHNVIVNYYSYKDKHRAWKGDLVRLKYWQKILISTTKEEEQGIRPSYYGKKMPAPIASIGLNQLRKLDDYNELRRQTAKKWDSWCEKAGYKKPLVIPESIPVFLRYPVMVEAEKKRDVSWAHKELGITLGVWFVTNIHPANWQVDNCPKANMAVTQCINFPGLMI